MVDLEIEEQLRTLLPNWTAYLPNNDYLSAMPKIYCDTPVGVACITETEGFISKISIMDVPADIEQAATRLLQQAVQQLGEYFAGTRQVFDFKIKQEGTPFQQDVWSALSEIGYGEVTIYLMFCPFKASTQ